MDQKKPIIITMASLKGGVGKSTLTILFSYVFKELNKKVLLIDLDPQNSLTSYFNKYISNIEKYNTYSFLRKGLCFNECINKINDYIFLIPSEPILENFNSEAIDYKEMILEIRFEQNINSYDFDYVLIDTPPHKGFLLKNALNITDHIIIPVQVERWSIESFTILIEVIHNIQIIKKRSYNISIVENQFVKNRNTFKDIEELLYKEYSKYIKGKIHYFNSIKVIMNELLEPNSKEMYYKEATETLKNIIY